MLGDQQNMLLVRHLQEASTDQGPGSQVKRLASFGGTQRQHRLVLGGTHQMAEILLSQRKAALSRSDHLHGVGRDAVKGGPQHFVSSHQAVQRGSQGRAI